MWTIIRFALHGEDARAYRVAFELLREAGFTPHRTPAAERRGHAAGEALPAAVVSDLFQDPAVVSRAVFEALQEAHLRPVAVTGCHVEMRRRRGERDRRAP
jgi:hypothetical protein